MLIVFIKKENTFTKLIFLAIAKPKTSWITWANGLICCSMEAQNIGFYWVGALHLGTNHTWNRYDMCVDHPALRNGKKPNQYHTAKKIVYVLIQALSN